LFLSKSLLLGLETLLFFKVTLSLLLDLELLALLVLPLLLKPALLRFKLLLLAPSLGAPEVIDRLRFSSHGLRGRGRRSLDLFGRPLRQSWPFLIFSEQGWWVLWKLGNGDKTSQVA
jgi:hypothetical protein